MLFLTADRTLILLHIIKDILSCLHSMIFITTFYVYLTFYRHFSSQRFYNQVARFNFINEIARNIGRVTLVTDTTISCMPVEICFYSGSPFNSVIYFILNISHHNYYCLKFYTDRIIKEITIIQIWLESVSTTVMISF